MASFVVVYDACVLPFHLRDLLVRLAMSGLFQAKWTDAILDECFESLRSNRPDLDHERLDRTRQLMGTAVRDSLVTGHEPSSRASTYRILMIGTCWLPPSAVMLRSSSPGTSPTSPHPPSSRSTWRRSPRTASCATSLISRPLAWPRSSRSRRPLSTRPLSLEDLLRLLRRDGLTTAMAALEEYRG
jgi:hypothetical protein